MVGFGEMIASAVLKELLRKLSSPIWQTIMSQVNLKQDLEAIKSVLSSLQAKLNDAERQSQKNESIRDLLKKLKAVAYDIEDMLLSYELSFDDGFPKHESRTSVSDKVKLRFKLPGEIKKMRKRLEELKKEMDLTSFVVDGASDEQDSITSWPSGAGPYDTEDTVGRIMEKGRIMDLLLSDEEHFIIPIYGLGGLGKTTLAQMVFYDSTTKAAFEMLAWVNVPRKFDLNAIRSSIIQQCGDAVESIISEKRSLIVLDDLWEEDNFKLENLETMLKGCRKGSKVIVTTRSKKVADQMNRDLQIELGLLPNEDCWTLFRKRALISTTVHPYVEEIGKKIVEKCQGLPLAVKSLGYLLGRLPQTEWEEILLSDIWAEDDGRFSDNRVLPSLKLSYYNMPSYLRLCFAYCSVFPKGSHILRSSLIQQWIALGFIQPPGSVVAEHYAEDCLRELVGMSFLQSVNVSTAMYARYTRPQSVLKMHDLVHELASIVAADEVHIFHASDCSSFNTKSYCRYMFLLNFSELSQAILPGTARALHLKDCRSFPNTLSQTKFLRVLDFSACTIDKLPDAISQLRLLKYLNVSGMKISKLPKLSKLHHLQALTLSKNTDLAELPSYICELLKLHYLDLHGCSNLEELPKDFHKLKELQHLDLSVCTSLKSLPSFSSLSGGLQKLSFLNVSHCSQLQNLPDNFLPNMIDLNMSSCPELQQLPTGLFKPMKKLIFLNLSGCTSLEVLPEFGEDGTGCLLLEVLDLSGCDNLPVLPESSTNLSELRCLNLSGCSQLQNFLKLIPWWKFSKLEYLNLSGVGSKGDSEAPGTSTGEVGSSQDPIKELELGMLQEDIITQGLLRLRYLSVGGFTLYSEQGIARMADLLTLPNFDVRLQGDGQCSNIFILQQILDLTHREVNIKCLENVVSSDEVKQLELDRKPQFHSLSFEWSLSHSGSSVQQREKASTVLDNLRPHRYLQSLSIKGYVCTAFPDWVNDINARLPELVKLVLSDIKGCDYIPAVGCLPNLQELEISNMPLLRDAQIGPCKKLRRLTLVALPDEATVLLFYAVNIQTNVQMAESSHGLDEEMTETGQEFDALPGSLPENQVKRKPSETVSGGPFKKSRMLEFKGWSEALNVTSGSASSPIPPVQRLYQLSPKLSGCCPEVANATFLELDYLKIEKCHNLNLHPSLPKSKEYFIKDSSLSLPSSFLSYSGEGTPRLKSKMNIEGCSQDQFKQWIELISTHVDELVITDCSVDILSIDLPALQKLEITGSYMNLPNFSSMPNIERLNVRASSDDHLRRAQSAETRWEAVECYHFWWIPYINIGTVAFFSVKRIEEDGILCSSNISLLYKHHDAQTSRLVIEYLENVKEPDEVKELANYQQLCSVRLVWCGSDLTEYSSMDQDLVWSSSDLTEDSSMAQDKAVLQNLRPHHDLETLEIEGYGGDEFCSWVMNIDSVLPNLVTVKLSNIAKCDRLPSLGQLANLQVLHISGMPNVKHVDHHVYVKLRELKLSGMNLEEWPTTTLLTAHDDQFRQGDGNFPNLQVLEIVNCPMMRFVPAFPGSQECTLVESSSILESFEQFIRSSNLELITLTIIDCGSSSYIVRFLQGCVNLEHLRIDSCIDLITLPEPIRSCRSLKKLEITNCWNFSALPEWLGELTSLQELEVQATKLERLPQSIQCLTSLEQLVLSKCNYRLRERCTSDELIKHIKTVNTSQPHILDFNNPRDIMLLQHVTSSQLIELHIVGLGRGIDMKELENLELRTKTELCSLSLEWCRWYSDEGDIHKKVVLEKLQPHDGLEILSVANYNGPDFDQWMSLLPNLVKLELRSIRFEHLHLDQLQNLTELCLSSLKDGRLHIDQLQNLRELKLSNMQDVHLHLDRLPNITVLNLSDERYERLHLDRLQNLRELTLSRVEFEHLHLDQLQNLEELHLSQIKNRKSDQPVCIECSQPLRKLQRIVMSGINNQELKISMQGGEGDEDLFPGLQHLEMVVCENLRFQPSIPRSAKYIISGIIEFDGPIRHIILGSFLFPSFKQVMGMSIPGSTSRMEIKNTRGLSSERWESIPHLELLNITELTIDNCDDSCPLPKCILGWKQSLRKLEILRCRDIQSLPEWLGEMASLRELTIETYWMETLHPCIQQLTALQSLTLLQCMKKLKERCKSGDDWINIKHIPRIQFTDRNVRTETISPTCT